MVSYYRTDIYRACSHKSDLDPHKYTAGRWLRNEGKELQLRQVDFDFDALCRKVLGLSGACYIADCENIEGRSNRVFKFTFSDSRPVLAKLPSKLASPAYLTTASEVATIKYKMYIGPGSQGPRMERRYHNMQMVRRREKNGHL
ncbi:hypothetical protein N7493_001086 [Penicillium malachiteum]|uniref:Uncharacterized protein n=1 Tax=Penicillium malachiteum TaxID=1324776 RepID=A0AAD6HTL1_9EURO|nr:hypothetical protein N7493_001086 [Penicillium malachiteum]